MRRLLGGPATPTSVVEPTARDLQRARWVGHVIAAAAARTPWRSDCYPQALTARILLRAARVPHSVVFGVRRDDAGVLRAHAWVTSGEVGVTGGSDERWTGVAAFDWAP